MYIERESGLDGAVVWRHTVEAGTAVRVLPDGCLDLMWLDGALVVAGPDTAATMATVRRGRCYVGLRFAPGTGPSVFGVPASNLRDRRIPLADLWPAARVRELTDRAAAAPRVGALLEEVARERLARAGPPDPALAGIVASLDAGATVARTAELVGAGPRRLHRRCLDAFGYGPKTLARILRLHRALRLARRGTPYATVAVLTGYADQAHLAREVKSLAGAPMGTLLG